MVLRTVFPSQRQLFMLCILRVTKFRFPVIFGSYANKRNLLGKLSFLPESLQRYFSEKRKGKSEKHFVPCFGLKTETWDEVLFTFTFSFFRSFSNLSLLETVCHADYAASGTSRFSAKSRNSAKRFSLE